MSLPWEQIARAEMHPLRVAILEALTIEGGRVMSPSELAYELGEPLGNVSYHVGELHKKGLLELVGTEPRRGALEHYYGLVVG